MERSERDQLEQLIKDVLKDEVTEYMVQGFLNDGYSATGAINGTDRTIRRCAERIVRDWSRERGQKTEVQP